MKMFLTVMIAAFLISGCGSDAAADISVSDADVTTIYISEDGGVSQLIVEDFSDESYDVGELEKMIGEEISSVAGAPDDIELKSINTDQPGTVKVLLRYKNTELYEAFNGEKLFYGTIGDARASGYDLAGARFINAEDVNGSTIGVLEDESRYIIITDEKIRIVAPDKIRYISGGMTMMDETSADASGDTDETGYVIIDAR